MASAFLQFSTFAALPLDDPRMFVRSDLLKAAADAEDKGEFPWWRGIVINHFRWHYGREYPPLTSFRLIYDAYRAAGANMDNLEAFLEIENAWHISVTESLPDAIIDKYITKRDEDNAATVKILSKFTEFLQSASHEDITTTLDLFSKLGMAPPIVAKLRTLSDCYESKFLRKATTE